MKKTQKIEAWIIIPKDLAKWSIGSLIFSTKKDAEFNLRKEDGEKIYPCEIIIKSS